VGKSRRGQHGAVLGEMALVVTFLSLVVFGIISFGILLGYPVRSR